MARLTVTRVTAQPGGRVRLRFEDTGYRVESRPGPLDWLLDDGGCALSVALVLAFGIGAAIGYDRGYRVLAVILAVLAVPWALVVLVRLLMEVVGELVGYAAMVLIVLALPLLVFPGVRRRLRRSRPGARRQGRAAGPRVRHGFVPAGAARLVAVDRDGERLTVTVRVGGTVDGPAAIVRYAAAGADGRALEGAFRAMFAAPGSPGGPQGREGPGGLPAPSTFA